MPCFGQHLVLVSKLLLVWHEVVGAGDCVFCGDVPGVELEVPRTVARESTLAPAVERVALSVSGTLYHDRASLGDCLEEATSDTLRVWPESKLAAVQVGDSVTTPKLPTASCPNIEGTICLGEGEFVLAGSVGLDGELAVLGEEVDVTEQLLGRLLVMCNDNGPSVTLGETFEELVPEDGRREA